MANQEIQLTMVSSYLPLTEYSSKYKVSISTLRRRIKADDIKYVFEDGKYLIMDEPVGTHQKVHRPSQSSEQTFLVEMPAEPVLTKSAPATPKVVRAPKSSVASNFLSASQAASHNSSAEQAASRVSLAQPVKVAALATAPAAPVSSTMNSEIPAAVSSQWQTEIQSLSSKEHHEPILSAANRLLTDLKKAYTLVLQEKEEQILHLREENTDLKTLVRALESDNDRMKR